MLIRTGAPQPNRLDLVLGELQRTFRPHRPVPVDPDSRRNLHVGMCCACPWQRDFNDGRKACDESMNHARKAHGDPFLAFVRLEAR